MIKPHRISSSVYGKTLDGTEVQRFTLSFMNLIEVSVMNYGATLTHLFAPNRQGVLEDVVLGFDDFEGYIQKDYLENYCYLGSTIGRVAGRVSNNQFTFNGKSYILPANHGDIHIHGGVKGWDKKMWDALPFEEEDKVGVVFTYHSPEGEENYPGAIDIQVSYSLDSNGILEIHYQARSDSQTIINPTNHTYFNLSGDFSKSIEDHDLRVDADEYLPMNSSYLPTGKFAKVQDTPFDFNAIKPITSCTETEHVQLQQAGGIDHCFVLNSSENCAELYHPESGRVLHVSTTEPGLQVYTGNYLNGSFKGKKGIAYLKKSGICLETQHFPDSCNHPDFPSILLNPGEIFESKTSFQFSIR